MPFIVVCQQGREQWAKTCETREEANAYALSERDTSAVVPPDRITIAEVVDVWNNPTTDNDRGGYGGGKGYGAAQDDTPDLPPGDLKDRLGDW